MRKILKHSAYDARHVSMSRAGAISCHQPKAVLMMWAQWFILPDTFHPSMMPRKLKRHAHEKVSSNTMNNAHCLKENVKEL